MYCRTCGAKMNDNATICVKCGCKRFVGNNFCPVCGSRTSAEQKICTKCQSKLVQVPTLQEATKTVTGKGKKVLGTILIIFAIILFIAFAYWFVAALISPRGGFIPFANLAIGGVFLGVGIKLRK